MDRAPSGGVVTDNSAGTSYSQASSAYSHGTAAGSNTVTVVNAKCSQKPGGCMHASRAEALKGGTADQLSILDRGDSRPWGFSYTDVKPPVKVWCMERVMKYCTIKITKGDGHGLLTSADVVVDILESVANESCARGRFCPFPTSEAYGVGVGGTEVCKRAD
ncbi:hypothetical protein BS47DRAFT_1380511 [Hydnum rufescens UP504]|uniref:Uncharacterized protein n=1 Tax=Hydnum rufescens UP504 TaxID=1448309 RepID=A0A9P6DXG1_9AGAM|nr:hypothetical protein BS47DRAFT_1380511 [Hydnum rufescens UP504]